MKRQNRHQAENIKLRRQLRQERQRSAELLGSALRETDYARWVAATNQRIREINAQTWAGGMA